VKLPFRPLILALALCNLGAMQVDTQMPLVKTLECMKRNAPNALQVNEFRIESQGQQVSTPSLSGRFHSQRTKVGLRAMLHITTPADLAGTRYLMVEQEPEDAFYAFLPALGKVRRLKSSGPDSELLGTGLRYSDMRLMAQVINSASITSEGRVDYQGRPAQRLRFSPAIADSPYRRVRVTVDDLSCAVLQAEFEDAQRVVKRYWIDPASLIQSGNSWYATSTHVEDIVRGIKAKILLRKVVANKPISEKRFDPRSFYKID
tara:strand:+ start:6133 stop:6915 length:783 start_codon:yes stop_codon:yes gene_type:complete